MTRYHWFVMIVASLGWLFDCLDQQLFVLVRPAAMKALLEPHTAPDQLDAAIREYSGYVTSIFLLGWATGGLIFGVMGDRIGRAKTMVITILLYSLFTGLSALSQSIWDFSLYRFLTGLGVGGEFAVGVALVAETMPDRARAYCLTLLQMLSTVGNIGAALITMALGRLEQQGALAGEGLLSSPWRIVFLIGTVPAILSVVVMLRLKEPDRWKKASHEGAVEKQLGSYRELFRNPLWRKHALLGLVLAFSGVVGLWAVGFFVPDLTGSVMKAPVTASVFDSEITKALADKDPARVEGLKTLRNLTFQDDKLRTDNPPIPESLAALHKQTTEGINGSLTYWRGVSGIMLQVGACFGMFMFGFLAQRMGRKPTFTVCFIAAWISTVAVFLFLHDFSQLFWLVPIMGVCQLSVFAGYAVYLPELFPTYLRSTGTSFCYNVGRFVAATGPFAQAQLNRAFADTAEPLRYAGATLSFVFLVALLALPFLPETKGKPLPE